MNNILKSSAIDTHSVLTFSIHVYFLLHFCLGLIFLIYYLTKDDSKERKKLNKKKERYHLREELILIKIK